MQRTLRVLVLVQGLAIAVLVAFWLASSNGDVAALAGAEDVGQAVPAPAPASRPGDAAPAASAPAATTPSASRPEAGRAVLYGAVTYPAGDARQGGFLRLTQGAQQVGTASLDRTPAFAFAGLAPGRYQLRGQATDLLPYEKEVVVAAPRTRNDVQFAKAWALVVNVVTPEGKPLLQSLPREQRSLHWLSRSLSAIALRARPGGDLPPSSLSRVSGGVGTYREASGFESLGAKPLAKQALGLLTLPADGPVFVVLLLRNVVLGTQEVAPEQAEVTFTMSPEELLAKLARVRLRVVDGRTGAPLAGARVELNDDQSGGAGEPVDAEGRITLTGQRPGLLNVQVHSEGLVAPPLYVELAPGADLDLGDIALLPGDKVAFALDGPRGKQGSLSATWLGPVAQPSCRIRPVGISVGEDAQGRPSSSGESIPYPLYPGRYRVVARDEQSYAETELDTKAVSATVRLALRPAARLTFKSEVDAGLVELTLEDASARVVWRRSLYGKWEFAMSFPPGDYVAVLRDAAGKVTRKDVKLGASGATLVVP